MKLSDAMNIRHASAAVVGEKYTISGYELREVDDKFNRGKRRTVCVVYTDKGNVFAPTSFTNSLIESLEVGEDVIAMLDGATVICKEIFSKRVGKTIKIFDFCS